MRIFTQFICVYEILLRKFAYKFLICQLKHFKNSKNNKTMSKILSTEVREKLSSEETKMRIALELGISFMTILRWIRTNHKNLTLDRTKEVISKYTEVPVEDLFEKQHA